MPCEYCKHYEEEYECMSCRYSMPDRFEPEGKCQTCRFDPRKHGICNRCVDYDKHQPTKEVTGGVSRPVN